MSSAIPTGIKILNWLSTMWSGSYYLITPLFFIIGFLFSFSFGGFTGIILANCIIDTLLHDSYFNYLLINLKLTISFIIIIHHTIYIYYTLFNH